MPLFTISGSRTTRFTSYTSIVNTATQDRLLIPKKTKHLSCQLKLQGCVHKKRASLSQPWDAVHYHNLLPVSDVVEHLSGRRQVSVTALPTGLSAVFVRIIPAPFSLFQKKTPKRSTKLPACRNTNCSWRGQIAFWSICVFSKENVSKRPIIWSQGPTVSLWVV